MTEKYAILNPMEVSYAIKVSIYYYSNSYQIKCEKFVGQRTTVLTLLIKSGVLWFERKRTH